MVLENGCHNKTNRPTASEQNQVKFSKTVTTVKLVPFAGLTIRSPTAILASFAGREQIYFSTSSVNQKK